MSHPDDDLPLRPVDKPLFPRGDYRGPYAGAEQYGAQPGQQPDQTAGYGVSGQPYSGWEPPAAPRPSWLRRHPILTGVFAAGFVLVGLGVVMSLIVTAVPDPEIARSTATVPATPSPATTAATEAPPADPASTYAVGQTADWEDGVQAVVRTVTATRFGQLATTAGPGVKVTITVVNGSSAPVELLPDVAVRLGPQSTTAEQVYADGCDGLDVLGTVAPGRRVTGTLCFAGVGPQVDVAFAPGYDYATQTWTGKVA